jgi:hypothetical protein
VEVEGGVWQGEGYRGWGVTGGGGDIGGRWRDITEGGMKVKTPNLGIKGLHFAPAQRT